MSVAQLRSADRHIFIRTLDDIARLKIDMIHGLVLLTGPQVEKERTSGLSMLVMDELRSLVEKFHLPMLIEADGSRQKPIKAPSENEPVIPNWVSVVVVVCGLSGLGKRLSSQWVHRPEGFAQLTSLSMGDCITPEALAKELINSQGGLKGIPEKSRRILLLNQVDMSYQQAAVFQLVNCCLPHYHSVVVAALNPPNNLDARIEEEVEDELSCSRLSGGGCVFAVHESIAGIILAAGSSSRMGQTKQLLLWRGEPLVRHVARIALSAGLSPVVVVTGASADEVGTAVQDLPLSVVHNVNWKAGQSASIAAGINILPPETGGAIFLLADQPQVPDSLVKKLHQVHVATLSPIVAPQVRGQRANPVLFDRRLFSDLLSLKGDVGGRTLFSQYPVAWVTWHDDSIMLDVDTLDDYHRLLEIQR
jgi:molybdenum cofactor cytidylyltransferase